ncbi:MAG: DNA-binding protein [Desulfocurvibacter africanus]
MSAIATHESVERACATLEERGERITPDNVRKVLDGGSYSTISRLLRERNRTPIVQEQDDTSAEPLPEPVQIAMDSLGQSVRQVVASTKRELTCGLTLGFEARLDEAKAKARELEAALADAQAEIEALQQEKQEIASRLDARDGQHQMLVVKLERRKEDLQAVRAKMEEREAAHKDLLARHDLVRERAETAERKLAIFEERATGEARERMSLETRLTSAQDDAARLRTKLGEQSGELESLRQEHVHVKALLKDAVERADREGRERQEHIEKTARAREEAARIKAQLDAALASVSHLEADLAQARKQDEERREQLKDALALAQARQMELDALLAMGESERADADTVGKPGR